MDVDIKNDLIEAICKLSDIVFRIFKRVLLVVMIKCKHFDP